MEERPWNPESVLKLVGGLFICISFGTLISLVTMAMASELPAGQQRFIRFLISTASFQIAGIVLTHFFLKANETSWKDFLGLRGGETRQAMLVGVVVALMAIPGILGLNELSRATLAALGHEPAAQPTMQILEGTQSFGQRLVFAFTAIMLAPLIEEFLFRGILYRTGLQLGFPKLALFGTSILFAAIHGSVMTLLPLTVLAIVFCKLYDHTRRLIAPILAHACFNFANFVLFLYRQESQDWINQTIERIKSLPG